MLDAYTSFGQFYRTLFSHQCLGKAAIFGIMRSKHGGDYHSAANCIAEEIDARKQPQAERGNKVHASMMLGIQAPIFAALFFHLNEERCKENWVMPLY